MSRKSSINKNSFYRIKAVGKVPDYLPNKPTVVGSRGQMSPSIYNKNNVNSSGSGKASSPKLPGLSSTGGIAGNSFYKKGSALGSGKQPGAPIFKAPPVYKYNSGIGGGLSNNAYTVNYNQNNQGEQGSIGSSGSKRNNNISSGGGLKKSGEGIVLPNVG